MKKFLLSIALVLFAGATMAQTTVNLTFVRNGENASVNVEGMDGVTATIEATSPSPQGNATKTGVWNTGGNMGTDTNILCTSTNTSAATTPITYTLTLKGIDASMALSNIVFTHITANASGEYQPQSNGDIRHCNIALSVNGSEIETKNDFDIWVQGAWGSTGKDVTFEDINSIKANNGTLTITLSISKGTENKGCFYGLKNVAITFIQEEVVEPEPEPTPVADFYHPCNKNLTATELMSVTKPTYIAIKGLANKNNEYWNYVSGDENTSTQYFNQNAIFVWEPVNNGVAGSYYLRKVNSGYMQASNPGEYAETTEGATVFTAVKPTEVASGANGEGQFNRDANSDGFIAAAGGEDYIVRFVTNGKWLNIGDRLTSSQAPAFNNGYGTFTIYQICELKGFGEKINVAIKNTGDVDYATFYSNAPVQMPEGVTAYYVKEDGINKGYVTLTADEDGIIAGNTGVILSAAVDADAEIALAVCGANVAPENGNLLKGTAEDTVINEAAYVLGNKDGIGLYKAQMVDNKWLNNANKAYLPASAVPANVALSAGFRFDFGGNTTGVEEVEIRNEKEEIYDLTGRRVNEITKAGVYIIGGRKVLVK